MLAFRLVMRKRFLPAMLTVVSVLLIVLLGAPAQLVRISSLALMEADCANMAEMDDEAGVVMSCCLGNGKCQMETPGPDGSLVQQDSTCPCSVLPSDNVPQSIATVSNAPAVVQPAPASNPPVTATQSWAPSAKPLPIRTQRPLFILNTSFRI